MSLVDPISFFHRQVQLNLGDEWAHLFPEETSQEKIDAALKVFTKVVFNAVHFDFQRNNKLPSNCDIKILKRDEEANKKIGNFVENYKEVFFEICNQGMPVDKIPPEDLETILKVNKENPTYTLFSLLFSYQGELNECSLNQEFGEIINNCPFSEINATNILLLNEIKNGNKRSAFYLLWIFQKQLRILALQYFNDFSLNGIQAFLDKFILNLKKKSENFFLEKILLRCFFIKKIKIRILFIE